MINLVMVLGLGGSGKSTLAKNLTQSLKIKGFYTKSSDQIMYTTRPKRGENDSDYTFLDPDTYITNVISTKPNPSDPESCTLLSDRFYEVETENGSDVWRYGISIPNSSLYEKKTTEHNPKQNATYVLAASISQLLDVLTFMASSKKNKESINLILVFISTSEDEEDSNEKLERLRKTYLREKESDHPNYAEVLRRFFDDDSKGEFLMRLRENVGFGGLYPDFIDCAFNYDPNKEDDQEEGYKALVQMIGYGFKNAK